MTRIDIYNFQFKSNLGNLKTKVDKIDVDKLKTVPVYLSKLSNVVKNEVVKKTVYENIKTTGFALKTKYDTDKPDLEKKITDAKKKDSWYYWTC